MYLKKLHISNFRCFRDYTIEFAPGVTVLFGKNGSGKSTLIHAIHKALSFAFKNDKVEEGELTLSSGFSSLRPNQYRKKEDIVRDEKSGLSLPDICIHAEADFLETTLDWDMYALTSTFALQPSKYKTAYKLLMSRIKETGTFPVFAYFSDSFPHISTKASTLSKTQLSLRNLGYLGWDDETAYSDLWITRLTKIWTIWNRAKMNVMQEESALANCEKLKASGDINENEYREDVDLHRARLENALKDFNKYNPEISSIRECLVNFSKKLPGIDVQNVFVSVYEEDGLCLETKDGQNPPFEKLPAGYKRIFYMALDIAYRSYILNGTTDSEGLVVIERLAPVEGPLAVGAGLARRAQGAGGWRDGGGHCSSMTVACHWRMRSVRGRPGALLRAEPAVPFGWRQPSQRGLPDASLRRIPRCGVKSPWCQALVRPDNT